MIRPTLLAGLAAALALLLPQTLRAEDATVTRTIVLKYASPLAVVRALKQAEPPSDDELTRTRKDFLQRALHGATAGVRPPRNLPENVPYPLPARHYSEVRVAQQGGGGELAPMMPQGITVTPIAVPDQNALLARGEPKALDELQELISLIDVPAKQVNVAVKLLDLAARAAGEWGADLTWRGVNGDLSAQGPAPAGGPTMRFTLGDVSALLSGNLARSTANNSTEANVTTTNNTPAIVRAATLIPYVTAQVTYNQFGQRRVDYAVDAVATGVELFVIPRINSNDSVTMLLRPSFITAAGAVVTPDGQALPVTQETALQTQVTVPDGGTMVIGGLPRSSDALASVGRPVFRQARQAEETESLILVRPRIIRMVDR
jgi:type II secretory pathway component GspD/PulD (secretin)